MANTYSSILIHIVFSTKNRQSLVFDTLRKRLYPYMGEIARENGFKVLCIGGTKDHVHILLSLNSSINVSKAVQLIKGGSTKWIHETFSEHKLFSWQEGYGAFSISVSQFDQTRRYIENQETHHKKVSFQEEYLEFLKKNDVDYDEQYVFG